MKIAIIYYQFPLYSGGSHIQDFINFLSENAEKIVLVSINYPPEKVITHPNVKFLWIPNFKLPIIKDLIFIFICFCKMIFSKEIKEVDLINIFNARGILPSYFFNLFYKKPLVCTIEIINNPNFSIKDKIIYIIQKFFYSKIKYEKIICWSKYYYKNYLKSWGIQKEKVVFIPNGININQYNPKVNGNKIKNKYSPNNPLIVFAKPLYFYNKISAELLLESISLIKQKK